jgi:signal peptidase I
VRRKSALGSVVELVLVVGTAIAAALVIQAVLVKPYRIPSESMVPTLEIGQRVLVNRLGNRLSEPDIGQVVVFTPPVDASGCVVEPPEGEPCVAPAARHGDQAYIKRLVGGPGDRLRIRNGQVIRNGHRERTPSARTCSGPDCDFPREFVVPKGTYYLMGDNRGASSDSRVWGPVKREWIIGQAFATYWPPKRLGLL